MPYIPSARDITILYPRHNHHRYKSILVVATCYTYSNSQRFQNRMDKLGLDYTVVSPSLLENATIHRTSSCFSLGIMEEFTEVYIQSLEQNLDESCKKLHDHDDSIDRSSAAPILPTRKTRPGPSSKFSTLQPHP